MKEYKVLSLWEPWASLLVHGVKKIETRPKPTSWTIEKGSYLIHAAKKWTWEQDRLCTSNRNIRDALNEITDCIKIGNPYWRHHFNFGHIIGAVNVVECCEMIEDGNGDIYFHTDKMYDILFKNVVSHNDTPGDIYYPSETERSFGDYREGRYAWLCDNFRVLEKPIPYKGQQGYYAPFRGDVNQLKFKI